MSDEKNARAVDDLMRKALADDVPPEARRRMEDLFRRFKEARGRDVEEAGREGDRSVLPWLRAEWRLGRRALAFVALLLVVLGGTLHLAGPRSALADSLFSLNTLASVSRQVRLARTMDAAVRVFGPDGLPLDCVVVWQAPGTSRIEVRSGGRLRRILTASPEGVAVEDCVSGGRVDFTALADVRDPLVEPVLWLATPGAIADRIEARWLPRTGGAPGGSGPTVLILADPESGQTVRLLLDSRTLRPVEIVVGRAAAPGSEQAGDIVLSARLTWIDSQTGRE